MCRTRPTLFALQVVILCYNVYISKEYAVKPSSDKLHRKSGHVKRIAAGENYILVADDLTIMVYKLLEVSLVFC